MKRKLLVFLIIIFIGIISYGLRKYFFITKSIYQTQIEGPSDDALKSGGELNSPLKVPEGFNIGIFADLREFGSPRVLVFDKDGVLFTSLTSAGRVVAVPDKNQDGIADEIKVVLQGLNKPHGLVFYKNFLYVAETDRVVRYDYDKKSLSVSNPKVILSLPGGGRHFTRTIKLFEDKLYTTVGSSCDTCLEEDERRAALLVSDLDGNNLRVYARGLRNTVFFIFDRNGRIWGNDMGRDFLGDDLPPDELNIIQDSKDYGWPWCYGNKVRDVKFKRNEQTDFCKNTQEPAFAYPAHVAALGLVFIDSPLFSQEEQGDLLVSFHGSWNSTKPVGYKIIKLKIEETGVVGMEDFITGWLDGGKIIGRPVDLVFDKGGYLYISDDKANVVYILSKKT